MSHNIGHFVQVGFTESICEALLCYCRTNKTFLYLERILYYWYNITKAILCQKHRKGYIYE